MCDGPTHIVVPIQGVIIYISIINYIIKVVLNLITIYKFEFLLINN